MQSIFRSKSDKFCQFLPMSAKDESKGNECLSLQKILLTHNYLLMGIVLKKKNIVTLHAKRKKINESTLKSKTCF